MRLRGICSFFGCLSGGIDGVFELIWGGYRRFNGVGWMDVRVLVFSWLKSAYFWSKSGWFVLESQTQSEKPPKIS